MQFWLNLFLHWSQKKSKVYLFIFNFLVSTEQSNLIKRWMQIPIKITEINDTKIATTYQRVMDLESLFCKFFTSASIVIASNRIEFGKIKTFSWKPKKDFKDGSYQKCLKDKICRRLMAGPCHRDGISELYQRIWIGFLERAWRECVCVCVMSQSESNTIMHAKQRDVTHVCLTRLSFGI